MKLFLFATAGITMLVSTSSAQLVSNFGPSIAPGDLTGSWIGNYSVTGDSGRVVANDGAGSGINQLMDLNLTGSFYLTLTASATVNPGSSFSIAFLDSEGDTATGSFNWNQFSSTSTTVTVPLVVEGDFDSSSVLGWRLATGGLGNSLDVTLSELNAVAVPEPSVWALTGLAGIAFAVVRRRRILRRK